MDSKKIYQKRLNHVIDYISSHLSESISLADMADVAGFSSFHFHRIFCAIVGETPADYVLRLRLELASNYLLKTQRSITRIAMECGFKNSSDFSRAFRRYYNLTPGQFRADDRPDSAYISHDRPCCRQNSDGFSIKPDHIRKFPDIPIVYAACYEGYDVEMICRAWERLYSWAAFRNFINPDTLSIGISLDDPQITQRGKCRYYAGFSIPTGTKASPPVSSLIIPGGEYAVFHAECRQEEIRFVYGDIYRDWLPDSGFQPANSFPYEIYLRTPENHPDGCFELKVCIPVELINP